MTVGTVVESLMTILRVGPVVGSLLLSMLPVGWGDPGLFEADGHGSLDVRVNVSGRPGDGGGFGVEWGHLEREGLTGSAPIDLDLQPEQFSQVPIGDIRVSRREMPANCLATENTREVSIRPERTTALHLEIACPSNPLAGM